MGPRAPSPASSNVITIVVETANLAFNGSGRGRPRSQQGT